MRLITLFCLICIILSCFTISPPSPRQTLHEHTKISVPKYLLFMNYIKPIFQKASLNIETSSFVKLILVGLSLLRLLLKLVLSPIVFARYIRLDCDLTCLSKASIANSSSLELAPIILFILLVVHVNDRETVLILIFEAHIQFPSRYFKKFRRTHISRFSLFLTLFLLTYVVSLAPSIIRPGSILNVFLNIYDSLCPVPVVWVSFLKVLLSNDVEMNPGDFSNSFFSICNWNVKIIFINFNY